MNRLLTILLLLGATAHGQIDNPPTTDSIGLGTTNDVTFNRVVTTSSGSLSNPAIRIGASNTGLNSVSGFLFGVSKGESVFGASPTGFSVVPPATFLTNVNVNATLAVTGDTVLSGVNNTMPGATNAASASSLMTRSLSDVRYLGEMWVASKMAAYNTTNPSVTVFLGEAMVTYTNGQAAGPYMHEFLSAEKYAGKTVRLLAYCRVNSTNGGNVQGGARIIYLTNTAGGTDSNAPISLGGANHGTIGVFTNVSTDVFPVATSTNQYLIFTSNVGTIPTNAKMILASFAFNRASTNTTFTNGNLYMQAVEVVVENP